MKELKCPNCNNAFTIDKSSYAEIQRQVRNDEFEIELQKQLKYKKQEIERPFLNSISEYKDQVNELKHLISKLSLEKKLAVSDATKVIEREKAELEIKLSEKELEMETQKSNLVEKHRIEMLSKDEIIQAKDEEIARRVELKQKLSTKMIGETLELHCENEFNSLRTTAFPNAYFEKDNDVSQGTKGDYIFREYDSEGNEIISIMFEMKNEADETVTKKKNENFFKQLDKNRNDKKCEYAILVSLLEIDNDLYNKGIVDVSFKFDKMYVIRPQFFIPIISLLRNAGLKSLEYKSEINILRDQHLDITNFEDRIEEFKIDFGGRFQLYSDRFNDAIKGIDTTIKSLEKIKENLRKSENHLRLANNKAQDLSIKSLTKNNETMRKKFEQLKSKN